MNCMRPSKSRVPLRKGGRQRRGGGVGLNGGRVTWHVFCTFQREVRQTSSHRPLPSFLHPVPIPLQNLRCRQNAPWIRCWKVRRIREANVGINMRCFFLHHVKSSSCPPPIPQHLLHHTPPSWIFLDSESSQRGSLFKGMFTMASGGSTPPRRRCLIQSL